MLWYRLEDLNSAECGLFLWCLSIGHIQYLSFCRSLTSIVLRNRAPAVEKSRLAYTNYFDDEKYSKQYCEIYNVTI